MKGLLRLALGIASAICFGLLVARAGATPTTSSRPSQLFSPAIDGMLAQRRIQCLQGCDSQFEACIAQKSQAGAVCVSLKQRCQEVCNQNG